MGYLFSLNNVDETRKKFLELGLAINLPVLHFEDDLLQRNTLKGFNFLTSAYTHNTRGCWLVGGKFDYMEGRTLITEIGVMTCWERWEKQFHFDWILDNFPWIREVLKIQSYQKHLVERARL
jgi:hypothetical protein